MHAFLAAFTSEAVAPAETRWVAPSRITCPDTCYASEATIETSDKNQNVRGSLEANSPRQSGVSQFAETETPPGNRAILQIVAARAMLDGFDAPRS